MKTSNLKIAAVWMMAVGSVVGAPLKTGEVTTAVSDVKISEKSAEAQSASIGQKFGADSTMFTGRASRAELTFQDKTVARIGANSVFRVGTRSRDMSVNQGSFLLQVPKNAGGATIRTSTVTAAITGTTIMMEYNPGQWVKFITLEGEATLTNKAGDKVKIPAGKMLVMHPDAQTFPKLIFIDVNKLVKTSRLMNAKEFGPLDEGANEAIAATVGEQLDLRRTGDLLPNGPIKYGPPQLEGEDTPNGGRNGTINLSVTDPDSMSNP